ncbi:MerR family transcriptional regulator [Alkalihalobacillus sp. TS-13]|uniref:MerR family transcriptional regulator n=1 Tax=Alkalihalobacillus sp. TS-13 TaxID=2842455 RepID=UPI001C8866B4|nr:MerR family transcriptional regulator [Alkalihalobacillus sp. TS-13]
MFKISEFSKLSQVSAKTLRYYDQIDLLKPTHTDADTGYRYYTADQLFQLNRILAFKDLGFTLNQIVQLMDDHVPVEQIRGMFRLKHAEIQTLLENEQARLKRIEERLHQVEKEGGIETGQEVVLKQVEAQRIVCLRQRSSIQQIPQLFDQLEDDLEKCFSLSFPQIVLWHGCEECEEEIDLEVGYRLQQQMSSHSHLCIRLLPETSMMATLVHRCHPASPCSASADLGFWIEQNGFRIKEDQPRRELFLHPDKLDANYYIAEVQIPVEKVKGQSDAH